MKKNKLDVAQWIRCGMPAKPPDKEQMEKAHIAASIDAGTGEVYIGKDTVKILSSIKNNHT
jgi:hypothetical protein